MTSLQVTPAKPKRSPFQTLTPPLSEVAMIAFDRVLTEAEPMVEEFAAMLTYQRPQDSVVWKHFVRDWIDCIDGVKSDTFGNRWLLIEPDEDYPLIMWSSHTDTVAWKEGYHAPGQALKDGRHTFYVADDQATILGADCTTGCWLMRRMAYHGVPGLYVWHASEESGAQGATFFRDNTLKDVVKIAGRSPVACVAFDRRGTGDIITHQGGSRTASDEFAASLAAILGNESGGSLAFAASTKGSFTDSKMYRKVIPECTNVSVGYDFEHSSSETQDFNHAVDLLAALVNADWSKLSIVRDPTTCEENLWASSSSGLTSIRSSWYSDVHVPFTTSRLEQLVEKYPDVATELLQSFGVNEEEFQRAVKDAGWA